MSAFLTSSPAPTRATVPVPWLHQDDDNLSKRLRQVYEEICLPKYQHKWAAGTITKYRTALKHWETLSDNPPLGEFEDDADHALLDAFMRQMLAQPDKFSDSLIHGVVANIGFILREVGPPAVKPGAKNWISYVPYFGDVPPISEGDKRFIEPAPVGLMYAQSAQAQYAGSSSAPPPVLWRTLLVMFYTLGINWTDLRMLTAESCSEKERCPDPRIPARCPQGWVYFVREKTKRKASRRRPLCCACTPTLRRHLDDLMRFVPSGPLFGLPTNRHPFDKEWDRLQKLAGIPQPYFKPQELRVTASTNWEDVRGGYGPLVLGQVPRTVNNKSYQRRLQKLATRADQFEEFYPPQILAGPPM